MPARVVICGWFLSLVPWLLVFVIGVCSWLLSWFLAVVLVLGSSLLLWFFVVVLVLVIVLGSCVGRVVVPGSGSSWGRLRAAHTP